MHSRFPEHSLRLQYKKGDIMKDLLINRKTGDLVVNSKGDISITDSVAQAIVIRLKWFFNEWRFSPQYGVPYYEEILIKNPSDLRIMQIIREEVMSVDEVDEVTDIKVTKQPNRTALITFNVKALGDYEKMEVIVDV